MAPHDPTVNELTLLRRALVGARDKQASAALPLFLVVGRRGAGKSSLLTHCRLSYVHRSTSNDGRVSTRVSDVAAFVEYDVHDDPRGAERELRVLVDQLTLTTRVRPLAGVVVLVPLGDLTGGRADAALRPVLDAVATGCGAHVPIHIVVTQLDAAPGYAELVAATRRDPSVLGVRLPLARRTDPERWSEPVARLTDSVLETSVGLLHGSAQRSPLRFGLAIHALAQPLAQWLRRLETPTRGADPLLVRSVMLLSTQDQTSASLAMQAILEDRDLSRVTSRRLTRNALRWTLPTGIGVSVGATALSLALLTPDVPPPPAAEPVPETPEAPVKKPKKPGFVPDTRPPGPKFPPEVCAAAAAASGEWQFQTVVTGTNPGAQSGVGIRGIYSLVLRDDDCELSLSVTKTGHVSAHGVTTTYAKPQLGEDPLDEASVEGTADTRILWLPVMLDLNNTDGTDALKHEMVLGLRTDAGVATRITGEWRQADGARSSTGYWGYLEGGRERIEPAGPAAQSCHVMCRLACGGWSDPPRVDRCRESCAGEPFRVITTCPS